VLSGVILIEESKVILAELPQHVVAPDPSIYLGDNYITLDFETTTELKGSPLAEGNRIVLACWKEGQSGSINYIFGSEYEQAALLQAINRTSVVVAHNVKFELGPRSAARRGLMFAPVPAVCRLHLLILHLPLLCQ